MKIINGIDVVYRTDLVEMLRNKLESLGFQEQERVICDNTIIFLRINNDESKDYVCFHINNLSIETDNLCFTLPYDDMCIVDISGSSIKFHHDSILFQIKK